MIRPMASNVSALSGIVANGHQAIHFVSSAPSKIPYGGFSPVRLQTRLTPRPPSQAYPRLLISRYCRYLRRRRFIRSWSCDQAVPATSDHDRDSSGPWLPVRLYCPVGSSLTIPPGCGNSTPAAEGPQFTPPVPSPHAVARTPVIPTSAFDDSFDIGFAFAVLAPARRSHTPRIRITRVA